MECSKMAVASSFRLLATILLLTMAGRCSSQQMEHILLTRIVNSIDNLTQVVQAQTVASEKVAAGIMEKFTSVATAQAVASEKVAAGITSVATAQAVASEKVAAGITSVATAQAIASEKVASIIMKIFALMTTDHLVCEGGWRRLRTFCYFISKDTSTWQDSRQKCIALNSDLVKITHDEEYDFLYRLAKGHATYIGLSDQQQEGTYRWVADGTIHQSVESWWQKGEPNSAGSGEDCIHFSSRGQGLNDISCDREFRYICKKLAHLALA